MMRKPNTAKKELKIALSKWDLGCISVLVLPIGLESKTYQFRDKPPAELIIVTWLMVWFLERSSTTFLFRMTGNVNDNEERAT
jgi:hypothetical protein